MGLSRFLNEKTFLYLIIGGLIVWVLFMKSCGDSKKDSQNEALAKEILKLDRTVQESNGSYRKLVDNFNSEKDLKKELLANNEELAKTIKKQGEKILMITTAVASFDEKLDKGITVTIGKDSITGEKTIAFQSRYPSDTDPDWFAQYKGKIFTDSKTMDGKWTFNDFKFNVILTEQKNGMWATRIDGPSYFKTDSIIVNSLPKDKIADAAKFNFLVGAGYRTNIDMKNNRAITISGGIQIKKNLFLLDASSNQNIGFTFIRRLGKK